VGEERAVELLKRGVWDFVLKDNLTRLVPVVERALRDAATRQAHRVAVDSMRESDRHYRSLFDHMLNGFSYCRMIYDDGGRPVDFAYVAVNRAFEALTGLKNVVGRNVSDVIPGFREQDAELLGVYGRVASGAGPETIETYVSAMQMWFAISAYSPEPGHFVAVFDVITDRKRVEAALRESESRYRQLFEDAQDGLALAESRTGILVDCNRSLCRMVGKEKSDLIGKPQSVLHPPQELIDGQSATFRQHRTQAGGKVLESYLITSNGQQVPVEIRGSQIHMGGEHYVLGVFRDTTERKRAQAELERLSTAIEQAAEVMVITDAQGTIQYVNPAFTRVTGYSREEALGQNPRLLKSGRHDEEFYFRLWATLAAGQTWSGRIINRRRDGTEYTEDTTISPVYDANGCLMNYVAVKRDISRELELEAQLLQAQKLESIGTLAGGIAHDLNNILFPLLVGSQELQHAQLTPGEMSMARMMEQSAQRGADIIKQILTFARGVDGTRGPLQTKHVIREVLTMIRATFPRSIRIEDVLATDLWPAIGEWTPLHQVLLNLCVNARDAMPMGGTLTIEAENRTADETFARLAGLSAAGPYVVWSIRDTGVGIAADVLPKIFDPFFTTKSAEKGTGLGLSTVHGIVKAHGGAVRVRSAPGDGATFDVWLPARPYEEPAADGGAVTLPGGRGEEILVVDDEAEIREMLRLFLEGHGYRVIVGRNGVEAIAICAERRATVKAVVVDMMMPEMGGEAAILVIRQMMPRMPVLAISGMAEDVPVVENDQTILLRKPFGKVELLPALRVLLDRAVTGAVG
jgi:PAS domain S-box-containing protein